MTPHPGLADLADLADGRGRGPAVRAAADHAAACAGCGPLVADLRRMTSALAGGAGAEPPKAALRAAVRIPAMARAGAAVDAVRTFLARLVFDSLADAAPAAAPALRGALLRQRLFRAGPWEVEVLRAGGGLRGSVVPAEEPAGDPPPVKGRIEVLRGPRTVAAGSLDPRGRFSLEGVPAGRFLLRIEIDGQEILVDAVDL